MGTQPYYYGGKRIPSVTTIQGRFKNSGGLINWAYNTGIDHGGMSTDERPNGLYDTTKEALSIGTLAHRMVELYISNNDVSLAIKELTPSETEEVSARLAFENFLNWWDSQGFEVIQQEFPMTCELYGGTPDAIAINKKGRYVILDWKTSKAIYGDYLVQCAAYAHLWNQRLFIDQIDQTISTVHICRFSKTSADFEHRSFTNIEKEIDYFLQLAKLYQLDKEISKRCK